MKKLHFYLSVYIIIAFVFLFSAAGTAYVPFAASADGVKYAYLPTDVPMYFATTDGYEVKVFLPQTYFVTIISTSGSYYRAGYGDLSGYVRQSSVEAVDYEPVTKYAYGTAALNSGIASVYLFENSALTTMIATVNQITNIDVYGYVNSTEKVYYCRISGTNTYHYGYLPASVITVTPPPKNTVAAVTKPEPTPETPDQPATPIGSDIIVQIILVVCLVIPSVLVVLLVFSKKDKTQK